MVYARETFCLAQVFTYSHSYSLTHSLTHLSSAWSYLVDSENNGFKFVKLHKESSEIAIVFADPRRMTDEFKEMIDQVRTSYSLPHSLPCPLIHSLVCQFNRLPLATLPLSACVCAVNCDDSNDHRKFIKKNNNNIKFPLLSDPTKKFMDLMKCRGTPLTHPSIPSAIALTVSFRESAVSSCVTNYGCKIQ